MDDTFDHRYAAKLDAQLRDQAGIYLATLGAPRAQPTPNAQRPKLPQLRRLPRAQAPARLRLVPHPTIGDSMLSKRDLLFLAVLLANPEGLYGTDFIRYGLAGWLGGDPYNRLERLGHAGLVQALEVPDEFTDGRTQYSITPAGALVHFNATH